MNFTDDTVGSLLEKWAAETPDNKFITYPKHSLDLTFREFNERVDLFAKGLMQMGVTKDTKVGIWANNVPDWLTVFFATAKLGAWLVTINTNYKLAELEYIMHNADIHTLCIIRGYRDSDYVNMLYKIAPELKRCYRGKLKCEKLKYLRNIILLEEESYEGIYRTSEVLEFGRQADEQKYEQMKASIGSYDIVNMQYTSGTTGFPKGVMLSHHNIINNAFDTGEILNYTPEDRLLLCLPMFHCFGIVLGVLGILTHGASLVITEDFDPLNVLKAIEKERCTALYGVPTMFVAELNHADFDKFDLTSLRTGIMAGSVCPIETLNAVMTHMNMKDVIVVYGLTETSPGVTASRPSDAPEKRSTTIGTEYPNVEVKIFDHDTGRECAIGEAGEICCRGYNVMRGYYKNPKATRLAIDRRGWFHSGDLAMKDADGFYHMTGRIKDLIIRGGENIYPREIENFIYQMQPVQMVEIVGVPDAKYGEIVVAFIILKEGYQLTQEKVQEYCRGQISRYKIPKYVFFVDDYPKTGSGKVQKFKLRELGKQMVDEILANEPPKS